MPAVFDRLVEKLKRRKGVDNPFAVARAQLGSDADIAKRLSRRKKRRKLRRKRKR